MSPFVIRPAALSDAEGIGVVNVRAWQAGTPAWASSGTAPPRSG